MVNVCNNLNKDRKQHHCQLNHNKKNKQELIIFFNIMKKIIKHKQKAAYWTGMLVFGLVIGLSLQFARAWVEPGAAPPGGNIGAPITTGGIAQTKTGGFTDVNYVQAPGIYAQIFYDDVDRSYYADPNSQSEFKGLYLRGGYEYLSPSSAIADVDSGGNWMGYYLKPSSASVMNIIYAYGHIEAPTYYDIEDTNYYVNPNGFSGFNSAIFSSDRGSSVSVGAWLNQTGSSGKYGVYGGGDYFGVEGYETDTKVYGILGYSGYGVYTNGPIKSESYIIGDHVSGQYFSDSNDPSNYYVDPSSWSSLYHITARGGLTLPFGNYGSGQVLISDSNGGAYWANPCTVVGGCGVTCP
jgi:hypothetical protein